MLRVPQLREPNASTRKQALERRRNRAYALGVNRCDTGSPWAESSLATAT